MTKTLMNKLRYIFLKVYIQFGKNILFSVRVDLENFDLKIVKIVLSLVWVSLRTTSRVEKFTMLKRFRCDFLKTNIKLEVTR